MAGNPMKVLTPLSASVGLAVSGAAGLIVNQGGINVNSGKIIAKDVELSSVLSSSSDITASGIWLANGITIANGQFYGPSASFTDLKITGKLDVQGVMDVVNRTDLHISDKLIVIASGSNEEQADQAGIQIQGAGLSLLWNSGSNALTLNKNLTVEGKISGSALAINGNVDFGNELTDVVRVTGSLQVSGANGYFDVASDLKAINDSIAGGTLVKSDKYTDLRLVLTTSVADYSVEDAVFHISGTQAVAGLNALTAADLADEMAHVSIDVATRVYNTNIWLNDLVSVKVEPELNNDDSKYYPLVTVSAPALEANSTVRLILVNEKSGSINL